MRVFNVGDTGRKIGEGQPAFVIAEIGINHQGDVTIARRLVKSAKECGADAVKFQKRKITRILTREGLDMPYENPNSFGKTYGEHKHALELSDADYRDLIEYSAELDVIFCASGWDEESVDFIDELGVPFFKMASADLTNFPLLEHAAGKGKPMLLSTGMADLSTVRRAYEHTVRFNGQVALLQCTSTYPCDFAEVHLNVLKTYAREFPDAVLGYSGHEAGIAMPPVAVALGAKIIERHFTLDRTWKGGDHAASLEPTGLRKMVRDIRHVEEAMGDGEKRIQESEIPVFKKLAKSIVSSVDIAKGQKITRDMLTTKGPGSGISPMEMERVEGTTALKDIPRDTVLAEEDIQWRE